MDKKQEMETEIRQFLTNNVRHHALRTQETDLNDRLSAEILVVIVGTKEHLVNDKSLPRLETVKDYLRFDVSGKPRQNNPYGMDVNGGADAKVQKDMLRVCRNALLYDGVQHNIVCKEINKNAIIFFDITTAEQVITAEKDKKKADAMKEKMTKILRLKTREGYERLKF